MMIMKKWHVVLILAAYLTAASESAPSSHHQDEEGDYHDEADEPRQPYDPDHEPPLYPCLRNPTWKSLNYETCQELTEWYADDQWTTHDSDNVHLWLQGKEEDLSTCLDEAFGSAKGKYAWASCDEANKSDVCEVLEQEVMAHYFREEQGHLMMIENALTEQEAFGLEALAECVRKFLPLQPPFYEAREFGDDSTTADYGMYNEAGGNYVNFLQGLLQQYLPGVAASLYSAIQTAYDDADWAALDFPPPESLGIRTAEYLRYEKTGKLGAHTDSGSVFSISVALSDTDDYEGGFFQLETGDALFKVPRRSAIVFFSESYHSITEITNGERKVFVVELWEEQDTPVGLPRPTHEQFEEHKEKRRPYVPEVEENAGDEL